MASLTEHHSSKFVKLLLIGDSGTGKTGALTSLVEAGYNLRILDLDNGLDSLRQWVGRVCPDKAANVNFITLRDEMKVTPIGPVIIAKAYVAALKFLTTWEDGSTPSDSTDKDILVLDTLTSLGKACFEWAKAQNPTSKDPRQWFFAAQQSLENVIGMLASERFHSNVIVISHINYKELEENVHKGYPSAIGSALGPALPRYFNTMLQVEIMGAGKATKRYIRTLPTSVIDIKTPAPFKLEERYELSDGLAKIFEALKTI